MRGRWKLVADGGRMWWELRLFLVACCLCLTMFAVFIVSQKEPSMVEAELRITLPPEFNLLVPQEEPNALKNSPTVFASHYEPSDHVYTLESNNQTKILSFVARPPHGESKSDGSDTKTYGPIEIILKHRDPHKSVCDENVVRSHHFTKPHDPVGTSSKLDIERSSTQVSSEVQNFNKPIDETESEVQNLYKPIDETDSSNLNLPKSNEDLSKPNVATEASHGQEPFKSYDSAGAFSNDRDKSIQDNTSQGLSQPSGETTSNGDSPKSSSTEVFPNDQEASKSHKAYSDRQNLLKPYRFFSAGPRDLNIQENTSEGLLQPSGETTSQGDYPESSSTEVSPNVQEANKSFRAYSDRQSSMKSYSFLKAEPRKGLSRFSESIKSILRPFSPNKSRGTETHTNAQALSKTDEREATSLESSFSSSHNMDETNSYESTVPQRRHPRRDFSPSMPPEGVLFNQVSHLGDNVTGDSSSFGNSDVQSRHQDLPPSDSPKRTRFDHVSFPGRPKDKYNEAMTGKGEGKDQYVLLINSIAPIDHSKQKSFGGRPLPPPPVYRMFHVEGPVAQESGVASQSRPYGLGSHSSHITPAPILRRNTGLSPRGFQHGNTEDPSSNESNYRRMVIPHIG